jgi:prevent-host-death family protein
MARYGVLEAKNQFSQLIKRVQQGEDVSITKHGKVVASISKRTEIDDDMRAKAAEAIEWVRANRAGNSLGDLTIKQLIEDGRR